VASRLHDQIDVVETLCQRADLVIGTVLVPGATAHTSTFVLSNMTVPFVLALAEKGLRRALGEDAHVRNGLNVYDGSGHPQGRARCAEAALHEAGGGVALLSWARTHKHVRADRLQESALPPIADNH
jgi:alanine dehydrogenase